MKTNVSAPPEVVAPQQEVVAPRLPSTEPTLRDDWAATARIATLQTTAPRPGGRAGQVIRFTAKWSSITVVCAAVLWPIVDTHINYCFKSVPQYLEQEWVWWVKTTR
jgi:hypothetical protein